jgi:ribose-phosphate pyrophosphokinase
MALLLLAMPGNDRMTLKLVESLSAEVGTLLVRQFPDRESYVRLGSSVEGRDVALVCTLDNPDPKLASLLFAADVVRDLGGKSVGLIAPYLAYMRQDCRFESGEAITSQRFAQLLSTSFDWLATVDPHLHRYRSLDEVYGIPTAVAHAAPLLSDWINRNVANPLIVGPDSESEQWVAQVAARANAPHVVFAKRRLGDRNVRIAAPELSVFRGRQPVLVDDIASSGTTLAEAAKRLEEAGFAKQIALVVHPIFAEGGLQLLQSANSRIVSCDTVAHSTNQVTVVELIAAAIRQLSATVGFPQLAALSPTSRREPAG